MSILGHSASLDSCSQHVPTRTPDVVPRRCQAAHHKVAGLFELRPTPVFEMIGLKMDLKSTPKSTSIICARVVFRRRTQGVLATAGTLQTTLGGATETCVCTGTPKTCEI